MSTTTPSRTGGSFGPSQGCFVYEVGPSLQSPAGPRDIGCTLARISTCFVSAVAGPGHVYLLSGIVTAPNS
ncbi:hypothetical protein KPB2_5568 [Klebsiella pneumoniae Kb677]|nr:hypothetical protein KPB2_5568 [Klebsiella pneumoniae Kb677]